MHLNSHMAIVQSNIKEFNKYVKDNQKGLSARGKRVDDLLFVNSHTSTR